MEGADGAGAEIEGTGDLAPTVGSEAAAAAAGRDVFAGAFPACPFVCSFRCQFSG